MLRRIYKYYHIWYQVGDKPVMKYSLWAGDYITALRRAKFYYVSQFEE